MIDLNHELVGRKIREMYRGQQCGLKEMFGDDWESIGILLTSPEGFNVPGRVRADHQFTRARELVNNDVELGGSQIGNIRI